MNELLTRKDIAAKLGITTTTLDTWRRKGLIPYLRFGGRIKFDWNEVMAVMETKKVPRKSP